MTETKFSVSVQIRLDWGELDSFGHINNISIFKYIQTARVNYWDMIGLTRMHTETGTGPVLVSCKCDFKKALFYPGRVTIRSRAEFIKNTSFSLYHEIYDDREKLAAQAQDIMVLFDFTAKNKIPFPDELKSAIEKLENRAF